MNLVYLVSFVLLTSDPQNGITFQFLGADPQEPMPVEDCLNKARALNSNAETPVFVACIPVLNAEASTTE